MCHNAWWIGCASMLFNKPAITRLVGQRRGDNTPVWSGTVPDMSVVKSAVAWCPISKP